VTFSPDGRQLYYLTDEGSEFRYLARYDLATGAHTTVLQPQWNVMGAIISPAGRYLLVAINNDARTELRIFELETMEPVSLPAMPDGQIRPLAISGDDQHLALRTSSGRSPGDIYVAPLRGGEARQLLRTLSPAIDPEHLVEPEVVRFASFDGVEIPGLLYRPHGASQDTRVPAVIWIHGGPTRQSRVGYNSLIQYLVNHGYGVYAINYRGSSGYGKTFEAMNDGKTGEADLGDVVASKRMLIDTGWIDPEKIGVMGGSYGGYLTLAALTFRPEAFAVGVDLFGPVNWPRTIENFPPYWDNLEAWYKQMGHPEADRERLRRISPLFHADQITKPFLVLHGANDPRVLQRESDEMVAAARANGVPVEYIVFPDEGHGFRKKENKIRGYKAILEFLDLRLKGNGE
jgi:dipeptidyl aminopeptidase/acylaminoacyl peptidase